jgi:hypothetical protein
MKNEREFNAVYNNAKRAARVCLSERECYSPVYVMIAMDRMYQAISEAAAPYHLEDDTAAPHLVVIDTNPCLD